MEKGLYQLLQLVLQESNPVTSLNLELLNVVYNVFLERVRCLEILVKSRWN